MPARILACQLPELNQVLSACSRWFPFLPETPPIISLLRTYSTGPAIYFVVMAIGCCLWLNPLRLRQSDLWDHVNYGRITLLAGELPANDPLLPLAGPTPFVNPAWASQILMATTVDAARLGLPAVQLLHAIIVLTAIASIGFAVGWRTGSLLCSLIGSGCFLYVAWQQFLVVRPQTIGVCFFSALFAVLSMKLDRLKCVQVSTVFCFAIWANLHGSFPLGLFIIGISGIGRVLDFTLGIQRLTHSGTFTVHKLSAIGRGTVLRSILQRSGFNRLLGLGICCAAATSLNPYGFHLHEEIARVGSHPNMTSMIEWRPLTLSMKQGQAAAWTVAAMLAAMCFSKRRLQTANFLLMLSLGFLTLWSSRMINWAAPVAGYLLGVHLASSMTRFRFKGGRIKRIQPNSFQQFGTREVVAAVLAAGAIVFSSSWARQSKPSQIVSSDTPTEIARYLKHKINPDRVNKDSDQKTLPRGMVFCPAEWTGYLMSETRQKQVKHPADWKKTFPLKAMVSTHVHVIPPSVWQDFLSIHHGSRTCLKTLNQYQINVIVLDQKRHGKLWNAVRTSGEFEEAFQSDEGMVWVRVQKEPAE